MENKLKDVSYEISESENVIMECLWMHEEGVSFAAIMKYTNEECGKNWSKQMINVFITRLTSKGLIESEKTTGRKTYYATVTRNKFIQCETDEYLKKYHKGSLVNYFAALTGNGYIDKDTAEKLKKILDENE